MILHGIYDNGKIEILEKDLPQIRAKVDIVLEEEKARKLPKEMTEPVKVNEYIRFNRDEIYE